jgi:hypothetical protein
VFFRTPDGLSETVASEIGSDVGWFAVNVGDDHAWADWGRLRATARTNGVTVYPWRRCFTPDGLHALLELASDEGVQPLPNLESELEGALPPDTVAQIVSQYPVDPVGWSTLGWLQNDVDFAPIAQRPALLQIFPTDMRLDPVELRSTQAACVRHARDKGFVNVGVTFQTYGTAKPEWYAYYAGVRSLYTGDDLGLGGWEAWS